jgi:drug/metabolite transporter (DMT)-like permease
MASKRFKPGYLLLLAVANFIWAAQGTAVKILESKLGPIAITFVPFWITTLLLIPLLLRNPHPVKPTKRDWFSFFIAGVGGQVLAQLGMTWGITRSLASNAAILNLLIPVISAVLATLMLHEKLTGLRCVSFVIGLVGVLLMSVEDLRHSAFLDSKMLSGNLLILAGCAGSSFYNVYCKGLMQRFQEVEILIYSYIRIACQHSFADLGRAVFLPRLRGVRFEIVDGFRFPGYLYVWRFDAVVFLCASVP